MDFFAVEHLSVEKLLNDWRWLCPQPLKLIARNAFGDLFLRDEQDRILWLNVAIGRISEVAESFEKFKSLAESEETRQRWFAVNDEEKASSRGLVPGLEECIGFATPLVLSESGSGNNPYVANIYDHVPFLGDLHRQLAELPHGAKVKLVVTD